MFSFNRLNPQNPQNYQNQSEISLSNSRFITPNFGFCDNDYNPITFQKNQNKQLNRQLQTQGQKKLKNVSESQQFINNLLMKSDSNFKPDYQREIYGNYINHYQNHNMNNQKNQFYNSLGGGMMSFQNFGNHFQDTFYDQNQKNTLQDNDFGNMAQTSMFLAAEINFFGNTYDINELSERNQTEQNFSKQYQRYYNSSYNNENTRKQQNMNRTSANNKIDRKQGFKNQFFYSSSNKNQSFQYNQTSNNINQRKYKQLSQFIIYEVDSKFQNGQKSQTINNQQIESNCENITIKNNDNQYYHQSINQEKEITNSNCQQSKNLKDSLLSQQSIIDRIDKIFDNNDFKKNQTIIKKSNSKNHFYKQQNQQKQFSQPKSQYLQKPLSHRNKRQIGLFYGSSRDNKSLTNNSNYDINKNNYQAVSRSRIKISNKNNIYDNQKNSNMKLSKVIEVNQHQSQKSSYNYKNNNSLNNVNNQKNQRITTFNDNVTKNLKNNQKNILITQSIVTQIFQNQKKNIQKKFYSIKKNKVSQNNLNDQKQKKQYQRKKLIRTFDFRKNKQQSNRKIKNKKKQQKNQKMSLQKIQQRKQQQNNCEKMQVQKNFNSNQDVLNNKNKSNNNLIHNKHVLINNNKNSNLNKNQISSLNNHNTQNIINNNSDNDNFNKKFHKQLIFSTRFQKQNNFQKQEIKQKMKKQDQKYFNNTNKEQQKSQKSQSSFSSSIELEEIQEINKKFIQKQEQNLCIANNNTIIQGIRLNSQLYRDKSRKNIKQKYQNQINKETILSQPQTYYSASFDNSSNENSLYIDNHSKYHSQNVIQPKFFDTQINDSNSNNYLSNTRMNKFNFSLNNQTKKIDFKRMNNQKQKVSKLNKIQKKGNDQSSTPQETINKNSKNYKNQKQKQKEEKIIKNLSILNQNELKIDKTSQQKKQGKISKILVNFNLPKPSKLSVNLQNKKEKQQEKQQKNSKYNKQSTHTEIKEIQFKLKKPQNNIKINQNKIKNNIIMKNIFSKNNKLDLIKKQTLNQEQFMTKNSSDTITNSNGKNKINTTGFFDKVLSDNQERFNRFQSQLIMEIKNKEKQKEKPLINQKKNKIQENQILPHQKDLNMNNIDSKQIINKIKSFTHSNPKLNLNLNLNLKKKQKINCQIKDLNKTDEDYLISSQNSRTQQPQFNSQKSFTERGNDNLIIGQENQKNQLKNIFKGQNQKLISFKNQNILKRSKQIFKPNLITFENNSKKLQPQKIKVAKLSQNIQTQQKTSKNPANRLQLDIISTCKREFSSISQTSSNNSYDKFILQIQILLKKSDQVKKRVQKNRNVYNNNRKKIQNLHNKVNQVLNRSLNQKGNVERGQKFRDKKTQI